MTDHVSLLLDGMRQYVHDWRCLFLLARGTALPASPLPADVDLMETGSCYRNAFALAERDPGRFTYFEGLASLVTSSEPGSHGWCVDRDGRVVDPTWWNLDVAPAAYCGVPIPLDVAAPHAVERSEGTFGWWLMNRHAEMESELPRALGLDPL